MKLRPLITNLLAILGLVFISLLIYTRYSGATAKWNKATGIDVEQSFTRAYLTMPDGSVRMLNVKSWRDYENSDQLQFTTDEDITYLTHASRVILTNEK